MRKKGKGSRKEEERKGRRSREGVSKQNEERRENGIGSKLRESKGKNKKTKTGRRSKDIPNICIK